MLAAFAALDSVRAVANRLGRHVGMVRHIAHILDRQSSSSQVKRILKRYLNRLDRDAPRRGRGAATGHFVDHVRKKADSYWPGLFHTYDDPRIPRTTNALEGFFGASKEAVRRTTGRMSTAGGKINSCGEAILRVNSLLSGMSPKELADRIASIPPSQYREAERRLDELRRPARERRSIQRDPQSYLDDALNRWLDSS